MLWRAFWHPATPFYLKAMMVGIVAYVISPIDLMPDFIVGLGWIDDILLVTIAVNWIVNRLPHDIFDQPDPSAQYDSSRHDDFNDDPGEDSNKPTIDGTSRRR